jgi:hypothetical protein
MLQLRPSCECCDKDLPPDSIEARICSFECTFCADCSDAMDERCPNCDGELLDRPTRAKPLLEKHPASTVRRHKG